MVLFLDIASRLMQTKRERIVNSLYGESPRNFHIREVYGSGHVAFELIIFPEVLETVAMSATQGLISRSRVHTPFIEPLVFWLIPVP